MRLLLVTSDFPPETGGTQTYSWELSKRLRSQSDSFAVIAPWTKGCTAFDKTLNFKVFRVKASPNWFSLVSFWTIVRVSRKLHINLLFHVQWQHALSGHLARFCSPVEQVHIACHGRELLIAPLGKGVMQKGYDLLRKHVLMRATHLFPVSRFTASKLELMGMSSKKITIVNNGVDGSRFSPAGVIDIKGQLGVKHQTILLSVCRLIKRKGIDTVLKSLQRVVKIIPDLEYVVIGSGPDQNRLKRLAKELGVESHVHFLGRVSDSDLKAWYYACDLFVLPAKSENEDVEGFGLVFLEAGACGKASLALNEGGVADAVIHGYTGVLVEKGATTSFENELLSLLLEDERRDQMGINAQKYAREYATWDRSVNKILFVVSSASFNIERPQPVRRLTKVLGRNRHRIGEN